MGREADTTLYRAADMLAGVTTQDAPRAGKHHCTAYDSRSTVRLTTAAALYGLRQQQLYAHLGSQQLVHLVQHQQARPAAQSKGTCDLEQAQAADIIRRAAAAGRHQQKQLQARHMQRVLQARTRVGLQGVGATDPSHSHFAAAANRDISHHGAA